MVNADLVAAAKVIESLFSAHVIPRLREMTGEEKKKQAARIKRFLALPPSLQEGALEYAENLKKAYQVRD